MKIETESPYEVAVEFLEDGWPTLDKATVEVLANQAVAHPFLQEDIEREISGRCTKLVNAQFPDLKRERQKRGKLVSVNTWVMVGENGEREPLDQVLTWLSLESSDSSCNETALREHQQAADDVEHVLSQATPAHRGVLNKILNNVEPGDSLREIGRNNGLDHKQVGRVFEGVRETLANAARRIKRPPVAVCRDFNYTPAGVSWELTMETHKGAILHNIGLDQRTSTAAKRTKKTKVDPNNRPEIQRLPRPRGKARAFVEHPSFGRGIILRERTTDSNAPAFDIEFENFGRKTILAEFVQVGQ